MSHPVIPCTKPPCTEQSHEPLHICMCPFCQVLYVRVLLAGSLARPARHRLAGEAGTAHDETGSKCSGDVLSQKPVWRDTLFPTCWRHQEIEVSPQNTTEPFLKAFSLWNTYIASSLHFPLSLSSTPFLSLTQQKRASLQQVCISIQNYYHMAAASSIFTYLNYMHYLQFLRSFISLEVLCTSCRINKSIYITN